MEIRIAQVKPTGEQTVALLPGTVVPAINGRVAVAAPFAGTVVQVHVMAGQLVKKGDAIATLSSRELLDALSAKAQAEAEIQMADAVARRKRMLADKNIQSPMMAEEAEAQVAKLQAVIEQHKRTLSIGGIITRGRGQIHNSGAGGWTYCQTNAMPGEKLDAMAACR